MSQIPVTETHSGCQCGSSASAELDARTIPHAIRHAAIHGVVGSLHPGQSFVLIAPHDPLPLLAQVRQNEGNSIEISYVERGPEAWKLRFARR